MIKKDFLAGLVILLPFALTVWIVSILVNVLTNPFLTVTGLVLSQFMTLEPAFLHFVSRVLILITLTALIMLVGLIGHLFFMRWFFKVGDYFFHRIPIIKNIYKSAQDAVETLFSEKKASFSSVVLAPFPNTKGYALGFVSAKDLPEGSDESLSDRVSLLIPGTPNPMMGFMLMYKKKDLIYLDIPVETAVKFIVSCGVIPCEFNEIPETPQDLSAK